MYPGITKLAELIVLTAKNVSEKSWCIQTNIGPILGIEETDEFCGEINVLDDIGYRYIVLGNTKSNLTIIRDRKTKKKIICVICFCIGKIANIKIIRKYGNINAFQNKQK